MSINILGAVAVLKSICIWVVLAVSASYAQDFRPYPRAKITGDQWQTYFEEVRSKLGSTAQESDQQKLIVFQDTATATSYAFTTPGHPAHPAWITRRVEPKGNDVGVNQIGYFAGEEPPFAQLFKSYLQLNDKLREHMKRKYPEPQQ